MLLSIFVMYSNDRIEPFLQMQQFLKQMDFYDQCQKTLVVDGKIKRFYEDWNFVEVPRVSGKFCWGRMWDAGVFSSRNESILYMDSDRLLPKNYLSEVIKNVKDNTFVFTSTHFIMHKVFSTELCYEFLESENPFQNPNFLGAIQFDPRFKDPVHGPSKNVMSGSTAFTKKTYMKLGGVDHWYCGHGAYADSDFHYQAYIAGCQFVDLKLPELHYMHSKSDVNGNKLSNEDLKLMYLENFMYYCNKWDVPLTLAENVAFKSGIKNPKKYVFDKMELLRNK